MIRYRVKRKGDNSSLLVTGKYKLEYPKGKIVTTVKGTLGIFCFRRKKDAKEFIKTTEQDWQIYRVRGIGRGERPVRICTWFSELELSQFYAYGLQPCEKIPAGVLLYSQVEVLE